MPRLWVDSRTSAKPVYALRVQSDPRISMTQRDSYIWRDTSETPGTHSPAPGGVRRVTLLVNRREASSRTTQKALTSLEQNDTRDLLPTKEAGLLVPNHSPRKPTRLRMSGLAAWHQSAFAPAGVCLKPAFLGAPSPPRKDGDNRARMHTQNGTTAPTTDTGYLFRPDREEVAC